MVPGLEWKVGQCVLALAGECMLRHYLISKLGRAMGLRGLQTLARAGRGLESVDYCLCRKWPRGKAETQTRTTLHRPPLHSQRCTLAPPWCPMAWRVGIGGLA